jgi:hypothetical protein
LDAAAVDIAMLVRDVGIPVSDNFHLIGVSVDTVRNVLDIAESTPPGPTRDAIVSMVTTYPAGVARRVIAPTDQAARQPVRAPR